MEKDSWATIATSSGLPPHATFEVTDDRIVGTSETPIDVEPIFAIPLKSELAPSVAPEVGATKTENPEVASVHMVMISREGTCSCTSPLLKQAHVVRKRKDMEKASGGPRIEEHPLSKKGKGPQFTQMQVEQKYPSLIWKTFSAEEKARQDKVFDRRT